MKKILLFVFSILSFSYLGAMPNASGIHSNAPKIYLDCHHCDMDFIREKITFVNFVRDRHDADIHIFTSRIHTGSGGREYTMIFVGKNRFKGIRDTLKYFTNKTDTDSKEREKMLHQLKIGLFRFLYKTEYAQNFDIVFKGRNTFSVPLKGTEDPWDFWVFKTSLWSYFSGEESSSFGNVRTSFSASRVTEEWKFSAWLSSRYAESNFNHKDVNIKNIKRSQNANFTIVKSINDHWSWAVGLNANSSTYKNINFSVFISPGIEYDFYPYSEATSRRVLLQYKISPKFNNYSYETIYFKTHEYLLQQTLLAGAEFIEEWGTISGMVMFRNYMNDFSKHSAEINVDLEFKLFKGVSLDLSGSFEAVHDQIELPLQDASLEEILLQRRELSTQYNYSGSIGFSYTFGSIYNNIVNPRFYGF